MIIERVEKRHGFHVLLSGLKFERVRERNPETLYGCLGSRTWSINSLTVMFGGFLLVSSLAANSNDPTCNYFGYSVKLSRN